MKKILFIFCFLVVGLGLYAAPVHAEFNSTPLSTYLLGTSIETILPTANDVYIGGWIERFTSLAQPLVFSGAAFISTSSGLASTTFDTVFTTGTQGVWATVKDGNGGWYIGGQFTTVGGVAHSNIAHILANGHVDPAFTASVNSLVNVLALSPDKTTLYIGGQYNTVDGQARSGLAAVNATDGSILPFDTGASGISVVDMKLSSDGSILYIIGSFSSFNGEAHHNVAAIHTSDGTPVTAFADVTMTAASGFFFPFPITVELSPDDSTLYVGGIYATVNGQNYKNLVAFSTADGSLITGFHPDPNNEVRHLTLTNDGSTLYAGGDFTTIAGSSHDHLAALHASDGTEVTSFVSGAMVGQNPFSTPPADVFNMVLSPDETILYISGDYLTIDGQRRNTGDQSTIAAVNASTGALLSFQAVTNQEVLDITDDGRYLFTGRGTYTGGEQPSDGSLAAAAYKVSNNDLRYMAAVDENVTSQALSSDQCTVYMGGWFSEVNGATHNQIAAVNALDGTVDSSFTADVDDNVYQIVPSLDGSILYIGGRFTEVDGATHNGVAAINASDGSVISSFTADVDDFVAAMKLSHDGSILYIGGDFSTVDGVTRNQIAAINASDGSLVSSFNPNITGSVRSFALSSDGSVLYVAGSFTKVGVTTRNRLAAINTADGSLVSSFNPNANNLVRTIVLTNDGTRLYAAGQFTTIGGQSIASIASINTADGSVNTSFNQQNLVQGGVGLALSPDNSKLYAGKGQSFAPGPRNSLILAIFTDPGVVPVSSPAPSCGGAIPPTMTASAASSITATSAVLNGNITSIGGANPTIRGFVYGLTTAYGATTTEAGSFSTGAYTTTLLSLTCATTYHFKSYATNTSGTGYSTDNTFTTSACSSSGGGGGGGSGSTPPVLSRQSGHRVNTPSSSTSTLPVLSIPLILPSVTPVVPPSTTTTTTTSKAQGAVKSNPDSNAATALANAPGQVKKIKPSEPPTSVVVTTPKPTQVIITWNKSSDAEEAGIVGYKVKRTKEDKGNQGNPSTTPGVAASTTPAGTHASATSTAARSPSATSTKPTSTTTPVTSTTTPSTSLPAPGTSTSTPFIISTTTPSLIEPPVVIFATTTLTTYVDNTVSPGTTYEYTVTAVDAEGNSSPESDPIIVTTPAAAILATQATSTIWGAISGHIRDIVPTLSIGGKALVALSDTVMDYIPGGSRIIPVVLPLAIPFIALSTQLADAFVALPLGEQASVYTTEFADFILGLFGIKRKRNHLGVVFDSQTGEPIKLGYITLHDARTGERVGVSVSDTGGAYGFFAKPGSYVIRAVKSGYAFPSRGQGLELSFAGIYGHLYQGELLEVRNEADVVTRNIALDRVSSYQVPAASYIHRWAKQFFISFTTALFVLGFISTLHDAVTTHTLLSIILTCVYVVVVIIQLLHVREWGRIYSRKTGKLLSGLLLELNTPGVNGKIVDRAISDNKGRFLLHSVWGTYNLKVYEFGNPVPVTMRQVIVKKNGVVNGDYSL